MSLPVVTVKVVPLPLTTPALEVTTVPASTVTVVIYLELSGEQIEETSVRVGAGFTVTVTVSMAEQLVNLEVTVT